jgi:hypothetical protein
VADRHQHGSRQPAMLPWRRLERCRRQGGGAVPLRRRRSAPAGPRRRRQPRGRDQPVVRRRRFVDRALLAERPARIPSPRRQRHPLAGLG